MPRSCGDHPKWHHRLRPYGNHSEPTGCRFRCYKKRERQRAPSVIAEAMDEAVMVEFTEASFDTEVLKSEEPVLVYFSAPWCGPCKTAFPIFEQAITEAGGSVKGGKVDVDAEPGLMRTYGIRSVPTIIVFKGGKIVNQVTGAQSKANVNNLIVLSLAGE